MNKTVVVNKKTAEFLLKGNSWIYERSIIKKDNIKDCDIVKVLSDSDDFIGYGYYCADSVIKVRLLSYSDKDYNFDKEFFFTKFKECLLFRKNIYSEKSSYRLVFSEGDLLSGLICDVFENIIVIQCNTKGMYSFIDNIKNALIELLSPECIYLKSASITEIKHEGVIFGELKDEVFINENEIKYSINIKEYQKTGFFLDQYLNRKRIQRFCKDKAVLDIFCNSGGFGFNALKAEANSVTFVDYSCHLNEVIKRNTELNGFDKNRIEFLQCDAFDFVSSHTQKYDVIILDPPAMTKSKKKTKDAIKGYLYLNIKALSMLKKDGILATFSCSQNIDKDTFYALCGNAMKKSDGIFQIIDYAAQSYDHPVINGQPETHYLKGLFIRKIM